MANPVFRDGEAPHKSAARVGLIYRVPDAQFLRDNDMGGTWIVYVSALKSHFERVTGDTTTPDDGASVIVNTATGARWKIVQGVSGGVHIDAVGNTGGRDAYDNEEQGFAYYDNEADLLYIKQSAASADWSSGVPIRGSDGAPGPAGAGFNPAGMWSISTSYDKNDLVSFGTRSFVSFADGNIGNEPPSSDADDTYWQFVPAAQGAKGEKGDKGDAATIAVGTVTTVSPSDPATVTNSGTSSAAVFDFEIPQGDDGADGKSFVWKGAYSGATAYVADDVVRDQGSSWIALQATTGNAPPSLPTTSNSYWELAAEKGADGSGSGDVTAASNIANNALVVGDGGGKGVKAHASGAPGTAAFADTGDFATAAQGGKADTAVQKDGSEAMTGALTVAEIATPDAPAAGQRSVYPTATGWKSLTSDGMETDLGSAYDYATKADAEAASIPIPVEHLRTAGYFAAGDGGGALYKRVETEPSHAGKIQSADGAWWEIVPENGQLNVRQFGAAGDGTTDDTGAFDDALAVANALGGCTVIVPSGEFVTSDAIRGQDNVWLAGLGLGSIIKSLALADGGAGIGHRQFDGDGKSGWKVSDLTFDCSGMTSFVRSVMCVSGRGSSGFEILRNYFKTPGAATACPQSSNYLIEGNFALISATDAVFHHDGAYDQWWGSHDFKILNNRVNGEGLGEHPILVTGTNDSGSEGSGCYNFEIAGNTVQGCQTGIWVNGRTGVHHDFSIHDNKILDTTTYFGVGISDCLNFQCVNNLIVDAYTNGITVYSETGSGATHSGKKGIVSGNIIHGANVGETTGAAASAVLINNACEDITLEQNIVSGTKHDRALRLGAATSKIRGGQSNIWGAGTVGVILDQGTNNQVADGPAALASGTYTPTLTAVANVADSTAALCYYRRIEDQVEVWGSITIDPTTASTLTQIGVSLPIASNLASAHDLRGLAGAPVGGLGLISGDATNDRAELAFNISNDTNQRWTFNFSYEIK